MPNTPLPLKIMAARGMVPASPDVMLKVLYQLHFDSDERVQKEIDKTIQDMPENVLIPAVQSDQPDVVLDWISQVGRRALLDSVVLHKNTHDATIASLARHHDGDLCEMIANNQVRILRYPIIIEQMYQNANARMATVDRLLEFAQRNNLILKNLPGVQQALESKESIFAESSGGVEDSAFEAMLATESEKAELEEVRFSQLDDKNLTRSQREKLQRELYGELEKNPEASAEELEQNAPKKSDNLYTQIGNMTTAQKIRLATVGGKEAINILVRDTNKLVHMAAIKSPRIRVSDVRSLAANKGIPEGVIKYIASNKDWTRNYDIIVSLVQNPKTPLSDTMGFLNHLRSKELRDLARDRNVAHQVSRMAKSLLSKRTGG